MLSNRYANDGRPTLRLNAQQQKTRDQIISKIADGTYTYESISCCICNSNRNELLAEKDRYGLELQVVICQSCGLIYTSPRMDADSYARFYDSEYRALYHGKSFTAVELFEKGYSRGREISSFLEASGLSLRNKRVFEVGCGAGGALAFFRDTYESVVSGCDYGSEGIDFANTQYNLELKEGDLDTAPPPWQADVIIYSHVFEHILDLKSECLRIRHFLSKGGAVYIEIPSVKCIRKRYDWDFLRLLQNAHTYHFTLATLCNVMSRHGFHLKTGNEFVKALFSVSEPTNEFASDYAEVMQFLVETERRRPLATIIANGKRKGGSLARAMGLGPTINKLLGRSEPSARCL